MPVILSVKPARRGGRLLLQLDDGSLLRVTRDIAAEWNLREGTSLTAEMLEALAAHGGIRADEAAAMILGRRACSQAELSDKLAERGYQPSEIEEALEKLSDYGLVDDAAYAAALTERAAARHQSRRALLFELTKRGIDRETALAAAEALPEPADALDELIAARLRGARLDRAARDRMYRFLAGRGFSPSDIGAALSRYAQQQGDEDAASLFNS